MNAMQAHSTRFATRADIDQVLTLSRMHAEDEDASLSMTEAELARLLFEHASSFRCLIAEVDGEIVGYATFIRQLSMGLTSRYLYLDALYLRDSARGLGLGRVMMERVRDEARRMNCQRIEWQAHDFNADAIRLSARLGVTPLTQKRFAWEIDTDAPIDEPPEGTPASCQPISFAEPFLSRPTAMSGQRNCRGWKLKIYEITLDGTPIETAVIDAALAYANDQVSWPAGAIDRVGFVVLHRSKQAMWALVHLWVNDILRHFVFSAPLGDPTRFDVSPLPGFNACVWELEVTRHERDAWVEHVMSSPREPQLERYLQDALVIA